MTGQKNYLLLLILFALPSLSYAAKDETIWKQVLKPEYFAGKTVQQGDNIIQLTTPVRAEDPALVPIKVTANLIQTKDTYIKRIVLLIDKTPVPLIGEFEFTPGVVRPILLCVFE
nr:thiosulfate oxidation carrier protein SoxY [Bathymodiolus platifrons methanotrophic gill symbiont]